MTLSAQQVREAVIAAYPASTMWPIRVSKMSDPQAFAIYMRIINTPVKVQAK